jgi:two-component system chemotaxis response regulator CheY
MKRVVLVDDSSVIHIQIEMIFKEMVESGIISLNGYLNPLEFLEGVKSGNIDFDLIITDINMPQMNGLDLVKSIKEVSGYERKPVLIMTTETDQSLIARAKELNVTGWIVKPPKANKLIKASKIALQIS